MARQRKPLFLEALTNQLINQAVTNQESRKTTKNNLKRKYPSKITLIWIQSAIIESHNSSSFFMIFNYQVSYLQRQHSTSSSIKIHDK